MISLAEASKEWRRAVVGMQRQVPLLDGTWRPYVNLDNAATTPALVPVRERVDAFLEWYASVHRGTGFKSRLSTHVYERAREVILQFVGANPQDYTVIFTKHTTEAINVLAHQFGFQPGDVILTTELEHHANLLPWREVAGVEHIPIDHRGMFDVALVEDIVKASHGKIKLIAVSGASNVTGYTPPIHDIAEIAHRHHAEIMVDAAQLAPHRRIDMLPLDDPRHIDYVAMSGHKMYAPYGTGVLIGKRARFTQGAPYLQGGGAVKFVTLDSVEWDNPPERNEAGSPNMVGVVAIATAMQTLSDMNMERLEEREAQLSQYLLTQLRTVPEVRILGQPEAMGENRIGVVSFVVQGLPVMLVGSILGYEWGIGVRAGCFCAHPYLIKLLNVSEPELQSMHAEIVQDDWTHVPGAVRASLGLYNSEEDIDALVAALRETARGHYRGRYELNTRTSEYELAGKPDDLSWAFGF